jgi:glc operon protein GlcG
MKTKKTLTLADAKIVMAAAEAHAVAKGWAVTIVVCDDTGFALALQRLDRSSPLTVDIALGKARTAALARGPTKALEDLILKGRISMLALPGPTPVEGGVPIYVDGDCVGAVGASGVQGHEDAAIAQAGIDALVRK